MSRRRQMRDVPARDDVAVGVTTVTSVSEPVPCPGRCNTTWRRRAERADQHVWSLLRRLLDASAPSAEIAVALEETEHRTLVGDPFLGQPVWCGACSARITQAASTWQARVQVILDTATPTAGEFLKVDADGARRDDAHARVLDVTPVADGRVVEHLACGHNHTRLRGPVGVLPDPDSTTRQCRTCLVSVRLPAPGGLAPLPGSQGRRRATRLASPSLSPAWVEIDAALAWVCTTARSVQHALGHAEQEYPWKSGPTPARLAAGARAARYLTEWLPHALTTTGPRPWVAELGRDALTAGAQLQRLSGEEVTEQSLPTPCPDCDRRSLRRDSRGDVVWCAYCHTRLDPTAYTDAVHDAVDTLTEGAHP